jgi:hypothetical protein
VFIKDYLFIYLLEWAPVNWRCTRNDKIVFVTEHSIGFKLQLNCPSAFSLNVVEGFGGFRTFMYLPWLES